MTDPADIKLHKQTHPAKTWNRRGYRRHYNNNLPSIPGWNVSSLSTTGHLVCGKPDNINHRPINLRDLAVAMRERYDNNERVANPSLAPIDLEALLFILKLHYTVIIDAVVNGQRIHVDGWGDFVPVFQPYYVKCDLQGFEENEKERKKPIFEREIVEYWGSVAFIPDIPKRFCEALGNMYKEELPAAGRRTLMEWTLARRKRARKFVEDAEEKAREERIKKHQASMKMHKGEW